MYRGVEVNHHTFLTQHLMEESGQLHTMTILPSTKKIPVPSREEAEWTPELVWTYWRREKNSLSLEPCSWLEWFILP
jgi:hypothetical protein